MGFVEVLAYRRRWRIARGLLTAFYGIDLPAEVRIGESLRLVHRGRGTVIHPLTTIGNNVTFYHQVTLGRKDAHVPIERSAMERLVLGDNVVVFPGAKVLGGDGITMIADGTIVAADAVLTSSTGEGEVWGGVPARKIGTRSE